MNLTSKLLSDYCEAHTTPQSAILYELERETNLKTLAPQMLSGHLQGQFLSLISQLIRPEAMLEIGTFTGYSAICLAQGLADGGILHTLETNRELEPIIRKYIAKANLEDKISVHFGRTEAIILTLDVQFDFVFIDAGKQQYAQFYDLVFDKIKPGGMILADNVLWSGKVVTEEMDDDTQAIRAFNDKVQQDNRVENMILPLRDGILMARKK